MLKNYMVAHISFYDNILHMEQVCANSEKEALLLAFPEYYTRDSVGNNSDIELVKDNAFDMDCMFEVREIK